jgi:Ni,Fe-hydrogenase maturation factor
VPPPRNAREEKMVRIFVLGNPTYEPDSLALKVGEALEAEGFDVMPIDTPFILMDKLDENPKMLDEGVILDVAYGIDEPKLFRDLDKLRTIRLGSLHDFDMAFFLKLLKAADKVKDPLILAIPIESELEAATEEVRALLSTINL